MQTKLAFLFVLHVIGLGFIFARWGLRFRPPVIGGLLAYLVVFYFAWGQFLRSQPSLYIPETVSEQ